MQFFLYITTIILVNHVLLYKENIKSVTSYIYVHIYNLHKPLIHIYSFHGPGSPRDKGSIFLDKTILKIKQKGMLFDNEFSLFSSLLKRELREKENEVAKIENQKSCLSARSILKIGNCVRVLIMMAEA